MTDPDPRPNPDPGPPTTNSPTADAVPPPPATLDDVLAASWHTFWGTTAPQGWAAHASAAVAAHLAHHTAPAPVACDHGHLRDLRTQLERLRRVVREQLADAVSAEHLDLGLANGMLAAFHMPALARRWRVRLGVPVTVEVTAEDEDDAYTAATDTIARALAHNDGCEIDDDGVEHHEAEPGDLDTDERL